MAPKSKVVKEKKRDKSVMSLADKLKILDLLKSGEKVSVVARRFNVNESTIRSIRDKEKSIRESASRMGTHAQHCKISRKVDIEVMEDMLIIWMQDLIHKRIPVSGLAIREQALYIYRYLKSKNNSEGKILITNRKNYFFLLFLLKTFAL